MTQKESDFENLPPTIQSGAAALDDAWREKIPLVLGNYERLEELGGGGFGVVFKVRHTGLHWERAMKVLDPRIAQEPGERERFLREARVLAGLRYVPEVVRIDDISPAESAWNWLVMELVPGRRMPDQYTAISAAHWLAWHLRHVGDERGLPEAEVLRIFKDVLAALTAAHEMGIVHRDIAGQYSVAAGGRGETFRFRVGESAGGQGQAAGTGRQEQPPVEPAAESELHGHSPIHEPGTGGWKAARCAIGHIFVGIGDLRIVGRPPGQGPLQITPRKGPRCGEVLG